MFMPFNHVGPVRKTNKTDIEVKVDAYFLPRKNLHFNSTRTKELKRKSHKGLHRVNLDQKRPDLSNFLTKLASIYKISHHSECWQNCLWFLALLKKHSYGPKVHFLTVNYFCLVLEYIKDIHIFVFYLVQELL